MGIIYSGSPIITAMLDGSTPDSLNAGLRGTLVSAGWTVVKDGSADGVWRLRSGTTPQGLHGDIWIRKYTTYTPNYTLLNASSSLATNYNTSLLTMQDTQVAPGAGFTYRCIANSYYFYLLREATPCPPSQSFMMMIPYIPPFLTGLVTEAVVASGPNATGVSIANGLFGSSSVQYAQLNGQGHTAQSAWYAFGLTTYAKPTWFDQSCEFYEARVMASQTNSSGQQSGSPTAIGYMWDALVLNSAITRGSVISYDGSSWYLLTEATDPGLMVKVA